MSRSSGWRACRLVQRSLAYFLRLVPASLEVVKKCDRARLDPDVLAVGGGCPYCKQRGQIIQVKTKLICLRCCEISAAVRGFGTLVSASN